MKTRSEYKIEQATVIIQELLDEIERLTDRGRSLPSHFRPKKAKSFIAESKGEKLCPACESILKQDGKKHACLKCSSEWHNGLDKLGTIKCDHPRVIGRTLVKNYCCIPIGWSFNGSGAAPEALEVSTVLLDGAYFENRGFPVLCGPETGFETMVFFAGHGDALFSQKYKTRAQAIRGHKRVVLGLINGKTKLALSLVGGSFGSVIAEKQ